MHLLIRADATPHMGTGHVMRCLALAQWALREGIEVCLAGRFQVPWVRERLQAENIPFIPLEGEVHSPEPTESLLQLLTQVDGVQWVVLDGYHFGLDCQEAIRSAGYRLLVIDDYAHLATYSCDILLNQNLGAESLIYSGNIGQALLGPRYALLRHEFAEARAKAAQRMFSPVPMQFLLNLGGGDAAHYLESITKIFPVPGAEQMSLKIIKGSMSARILKENLLGACSRTEILERVTDMSGLLLETDICITAAGSTCWELCCLGVPSNVFCMVDNQRGVTEGLINAQGMLPLSRENIQLCINSLQIRKELSERSMRLVDGLGTQRVLAALVA